jgi:hypothetical protein
MALSSLHKWRDEASWPTIELEALRARRSRRIITSALDDQRAMDGGPYPGHSLFTGCLIEGLSGGLAEGGRRTSTGREIGRYLQRRVASYPQSAQTPDFSTFELDDRGDILVPILFEETASETPESTSPPTSDEALSELFAAWTTPRAQLPTHPRHEQSSGGPDPATIAVSAATHEETVPDRLLLIPVAMPATAPAGPAHQPAPRDERPGYPTPARARAVKVAVTMIIIGAVAIAALVSTTSDTGSNGRGPPEDTSGGPRESTGSAPARTGSDIRATDHVQIAAGRAASGATGVATAAIAIDAGVVVATTPDASKPDAAAAPADAATPRVKAAPLPIDAPIKRPHRPQTTPPHTGSGSSTSTPPRCDRTVDTDCDGIPDVR